MRKTIVLLLIGIALSCNAAYDGVARLFAEASGEIFNSLSYSARYQLLNNYTSKKTSEVLNNLSTSESRILQLNDDHMVVATSAGKTVELKLLAVSKRDTVIAVVETVATPAKDSRLSFYDLKWNKLDDNKFIEQPTLDDFISPRATRGERDELWRLVSFAMIGLHFEGNILVAQCNAEDFFVGGDFGHYRPLMLKRVEYHLNKGRLKKK